MSVVLALTGGAGAAFAPSARTAAGSLAVAMLGVAGLCLALGNDFVAIVVVAALGAGIPSAMLLALIVVPAPEPDVRPGRRPVVAAAMALVLGVLAWLLTRAPWPPAGGTRQNSVEWLGSRFLTDHLLTLDLIAALLAIACCGAVALLRGRTRAPR